MDISHIRKKYSNNPLRKKELPESPLQLLVTWLEEALTVEAEANAMILATVNAKGHPSTRTVLLKKITEKGLLFFTNYESKKAEQITKNPFVSATFLWTSLNRQVHIEGKAEKVEKEISDSYWKKRPKGNQMGSICSKQSLPVQNRKQLEALFKKTKEQYKNCSPICPVFWGGYEITAEKIEFWQGRSNRLHDRIIYQLLDQEWTKQRLFP